MKKVTPYLALLLASAVMAAGVQPVIVSTLLLGQGKGKAKYKTKDDGADHEASLSFSAENLTPNAGYVVTIGASSRFNVRTNAFGAFNHDSRYLTLVRPNIVAGDQVKVTNAAAQVVLSGTLR